MNVLLCVRRGIVPVVLSLMVAAVVAGLTGVALASQNDDGYGYGANNGYYPPATTPPVTTPPVTTPPVTTPPVTTPPVTTPPVTTPPVTTPPVTTPPVTTAPVTTPPVTTPPVLPVTGTGSLGIAGFGLLLVGVGIVTWLFAGRRRVET